MISVGSEVQVLPGPPSGVGADNHRGDIAQLVEHLLCKQGVTGSNPVVSIITGSLSANVLAKRVRGDNPPEGASRVRQRRTRPRSGREVIIPRREQKLSAVGGRDIVPEKAPASGSSGAQTKLFRGKVTSSCRLFSPENHRHVGRHSTDDFCSLSG